MFDMSQAQVDAASNAMNGVEPYQIQIVILVVGAVISIVLIGLSVMTFYKEMIDKKLTIGEIGLKIVWAISFLILAGILMKY